jgi:simple sugar transport system substrate-binding protein
MSKYGPKAQLSATTHQWGAYYTSVAEKMIAGTWKPGSVWGGMKDGMIKLAPLNPAVPKDTADLIASLSSDIVSGKLHPFTGPVKDNAGKERLAAGKVMDDATLAKMDYYVEGVQGKLPAR